MELKLYGVCVWFPEIVCSPLLAAVVVLTFKLEVLGIAQHQCSQTWWSCIGLLKGATELS